MHRRATTQVPVGPRRCGGVIANRVAAAGGLHNDRSAPHRGIQSSYRLRIDNSECSWKGTLLTPNAVKGPLVNARTNTRARTLFSSPTRGLPFFLGPRRAVLVGGPT